MPWTTPPTFSYGYPASVDDLNIVRNNLLYLYGEIYTTSSATLESEVNIDIDDLNTYYTAGILWIEHKADNLYYRIRIKGEAGGADQDIRLRIRYLEDPYADPGDVMGTHTEFNSNVGTSYILFTNSDAAVDISGWGLTVGDIYKIHVEARAETRDNTDIWVEIQFLYEAP